MSSQYFSLIDEIRTQNAVMQIEYSSLPTWEQKLAIMSSDGKWFDDQFIRFSACFLRRDIIIHTSTKDLKYYGSPSQEEGNQRVDHQGSCEGPSIHIANIGNYHFQSIIPIVSANSLEQTEAETSRFNDGIYIYRCKTCEYQTNKASNLKRHEYTKHQTKTNSYCNKEIASNPLIKNYTCNICQKVFYQPQYLSRHVKVDHENTYGTQKRLNCSLCERSYKNNKHLTRHIKEYHSGLSYLCKKCGQEFSRSDYFLTHVNEVHKEI